MHGEKELLEKLGRNDPCPCGSGRHFNRCCMKSGSF
ncbi:SEC-C metal-binding domain-containing protein [Massilia pinisoli]